MDLSATVKLNNGLEIPRVGLGVFKSEPGRETHDAVRAAIELGYRHVDTAAFYENEESVASGIRASGVEADEVFVTTKVWNTDHGRERTLQAFDRSRRLLQRDVIDLYLIHWPMKEQFIETWKTLEELYAAGKVRAIGVSNFLEKHLEQLAESSEVTPAINQVEWHPYVLQRPLLEYCSRHGIQFEAWSPLARGRCLEDPVIKEIAETHGKTPAQVVIRWDLQHNVVTIPKSVRRERIEANAQVFDFELSDEEVAKIDALDRNERIGPHPDQIAGT